MRLFTVVGARPQFIKAAVLSRRIRQLNETSSTTVICEEIIHTGQHYDKKMSEEFFSQLDIPEPKLNLGIPGGSHGRATGEMLMALEEAFEKDCPDAVLVYGDTNTTLAAALAASKLHIPVIHIEAGLRSFNKKMPEEINRIVTDHVSSLLLCPTTTAIENLEAENIRRGAHFVGDVMYDAVLYYGNRATPLDIDGPFVLATVHRSENTDNPDRLKSIIEGFSMVDMPVLLPLHPRTKACLEKLGIPVSENIDLRGPISYLEMIWALKNCEFVMTDSGGLQKEAYFCNKYCITLRDETEWVELVELGANRLVGADIQKIAAAIEWAQEEFSFSEKFYGTGKAAEKIIDLIFSELQP